MELQSVSAGSGKTFHLAKIFIRDFLTYPKDFAPSAAAAGEMIYEGKVRRYVLRSPERIREAHSHILAITFTNKATNEMKERIVEKLADLARGHRLATDDKGRCKEAEYMEYFLSETITEAGLPPTREQLMACAKAALAEILHCYTDFNISTIDSFFQQLLRTFAYELGLNDNLELELDNDYLTGVGIDMTLRSANRPSDPNHLRILRWIRQLISICQERGETRWDILPSGAASDTDLRKKLTNIARKMSGDKLRDKFDLIRKYFRSTDWNDTGRPGIDCFNDYYLQTTRYYKDRKEEAFCDLRDALFAFDTQMRLNGADTPDFASGLLTVINAFRLSGAADPRFRLPTTKIFGKLTSPDADPSVVFSSKSKLKAEAKQAVGAAAIEVARRGIAFSLSRKIEKATIDFLFYVGLLGIISDNMEKFRENNNLLPLSGTNTILKEIVQSQADAPFIFERLGTLLNHILIDEFQDTSDSQWDVMLPLLENIESENFDNLIIGDAKQSIYRFRDAEPELIARGVRDAFPATNMRARPIPNKNWRSSFTVVDFNNNFFSDLATAIDSSMEHHPDTPRRSPLPIYSRVRQEVRHSDKTGYVEVTFEKGSAYLDSLGSRIATLIREGWRQRDIAVLCDRNDDCRAVIRALMDYNRTSTDLKIEIVSEEALSVGESTAVKLILAVLSLVADGNLLPDDTLTSSPHAGANRSTPRFTAHAVEIYAAMQVASGKASGAADIDPAGMSGVISPERVDAMLKAMPAISLPALVDAIVASPDFIPAGLRVSEAAYIAAFQDAVLDFCDRYPADPASFVAWWQEAGHKVNVASPEGADAVSVMTVHKSKGLEFGVVFIPLAKWDIDISKRDSTVIWVKPDPRTCSDPRIMPPFIPVNVGSRDHELLHTPYASGYLEEFDRSRIDKLNQAYVAFTRAGGELYINAELADSAKKNIDKGIIPSTTSLPVYLYHILPKMAERFPGRYLFDGKCFQAGEKGIAVRYKDFHKAVPELKDEDFIREYYVNSPMPKLKALPGDDETSTPGVGSSAPRDYGVVLHSVLCGMTRASDLEHSILRLRVKGLLTPATADKCRRRIAGALEIPEVAGWFSGDARVYNERTVLCGGERPSRPDRVIDTGSEIIVIDYKTGRDDRPEIYTEQLRRYMALYGKIYAGANPARTVRGRILFIPADESRECHVVDVEP